MLQIKLSQADCNGKLIRDYPDIFKNAISVYGTGLKYSQDGVYSFNIDPINFTTFIFALHSTVKQSFILECNPPEFISIQIYDDYVE